jgi:deoxyhypusine synthase
MKEISDIHVCGCDLKQMMENMGASGFQATNIYDAAKLIRSMKTDGSTVFLTFTANMMASGLRGVFTDFIESGLVNAVITTGGSTDHDIIRSYMKYKIGSFNEEDIKLHRRGINRVGNILIPNNRYLFLEKKMKKYLEKICEKNTTFTPTQLNDFIGSQLPKGSFLNTCHRNRIPVFSPGIIDSAVKMHLYFLRQEKKQLMVDVLGDMTLLADIIFQAKKTSGIVVGGGISKHHLIGANLLIGGLNKAVYLTTAQEYDGSLSGAQPKEAKSWGKISEKGGVVTVFGDATLTLPLIASEVV